MPGDQETSPSIVDAATAVAEHAPITTASATAPEVPTITPSNSEATVPANNPKLLRRLFNRIFPSHKPEDFKTPENQIGKKMPLEW